MNEKLIEKYNNWQYADFDDDMIGICLGFAEMLRILSQLLSADVLPDSDPPDQYVKHDPHIPRQQIRENLRQFLYYAIKHQQDESDVELLNMYTSLLAGSYMYHLPVSKIVDVCLSDKVLNRELMQDILLNNNMSPNWIKDPSGRDFSQIIL